MANQVRLLLIFLAELLVFLLATVNQRATAKYKVGLTLASDAGIAAIGFTLVKWIVEASSPVEQVVYVGGAVLGSYIGMRLTKIWEKS